MNNEKYKNYLRDLIYLMKEYIGKQITNDDFSNGVKQGYSEVLDLIKSQADAFGIDLNEIGFNDYDKYEGKN